MKALVVKRFGNPPEVIIEERRKPSARERFSLIRMHCATINQLSNTIRKGGHPAATTPLVPGNEWSGIGEQSGRFEPGTHAEPDEDLADPLVQIIALAARGHLRPVIDSIVSIDDVEEGYLRLASRKAVGSIVLRL